MTTLTPFTPENPPPDHHQEWLDSAVHPDIIDLNVRPVAGNYVYELLLGDAMDEMGGWVSQGIVTAPLRRLLDRYETVAEDGGWWVSGLDPLNNWDKMRWGQFKPDTPRIDSQKQQPIKYEAPIRVETQLFCLRVSWQIGAKIADRYGMGDTYRQRIQDNRPEAEDMGFWAWAIGQQIPIVLCEGAKKAGALLSAGWLAIALPGVSNGVRTRDKAGNRLAKPILNPWLEAIANPEQQIIICFDHDAKPKTRRIVNRQISNIYWELVKRKCQASIARLPGPEKGVDDFIVAKGVEAIDAVLARAESLSNDRIRHYQELTYPINLALEQRWISDLELPPADQKLICIKSPKNTGKTELLKKFVEQAQDQERPIPVFPVSHRIQLGQPTCDRLGLPYITEVHESPEGRAFGFGFCVDSFIDTSQARFNPEAWGGEIILMVDEAEQWTRHALFGDTEISQRRTEVLRNLQVCLQNIAESEHGRVVLLDADLSDLSIAFFLGLMQTEVKPFVIENDWTFAEESAWNVWRYDNNTPKEWLAALCEHLDRGNKTFICTQSQKADSTWSTRNLETLLQQRYPDRRILRIDSRSVADPSHAAYKISSRLNDEMANWDIVVCSPTLETGVSIDLRGHFDSVWACLWGVSNSQSARQFLARVREPIDRHVWAAPRGVARIANGETSLYKILHDQKLMGSRNLQAIRSACESFDPEVGFLQNVTPINTWGKMAVIHNSDAADYRNNLFEGLEEEGHRVEIVRPTHSDETILLYELLKEERNIKSGAEDEAIANAVELDDKEYENLKRKRAKTDQEWQRERRYELRKRYATEIVDTLLVQKDREGWHTKIRLHYYLTLGREFLSDRDTRIATAMTGKSKDLWMPTFNRSLLSLQVQGLEILGVLKLIDLERADREYRWTDQDLIDFFRNCQRYRNDIFTLFGIVVPTHDIQTDQDDELRKGVIKTLNSFLKKIGLKLRCDRQEGPQGSRVRVYGLVDPRDDREVIFANWLQRETDQRATTQRDAQMFESIGNSEPVREAA